MRVITDRGLIRKVAVRWREQYGNYEGHGPDKAEVGRRLASLDPETATRAEVDGIIGNDTWTSVDCEECGAMDVRAGVEFGGIDERTVIVCAACLRTAVKAMDGVAA